MDDIIQELRNKLEDSDLLLKKEKETVAKLTDKVIFFIDKYEKAELKYKEAERKLKDFEKLYNDLMNEEKKPFSHLLKKDAPVSFDADGKQLCVIKNEPREFISDNKITDLDNQIHTLKNDYILNVEKYKDQSEKSEKRYKEMESRLKEQDQKIKLIEFMMRHNYAQDNAISYPLIESKIKSIEDKLDDICYNSKKVLDNPNETIMDTYNEFKSDYENHIMEYSTKIKSIEERLSKCEQFQDNFTLLDNSIKELQQENLEQKRVLGHELIQVLAFSPLEEVEKEVVKLVQRGADVNLKMESESTALHIAARSGHKIAVETLIEAGSKINAQDKYGRTPLHACTRHSDNIKVAQCLVNSGAKDYIRDKYGKTAVDMINDDPDFYDENWEDWCHLFNISQSNA